MSPISSNAKLVIDQLKQMRSEKPHEPVTGIDLMNKTGLSPQEINLAVTDLLMERKVLVEVSDRQGDYDFSTVSPVGL